MTKYRIAAEALVLFVLCAAGASALTGEEIIRKMESNLVYDTSKIEGSMTIDDQFGKKKSSFVAYSEGDTKMLLEFTSVEERGQKVLRIGDDLYLFYPDASEVIRLSGSALRDSLLGSDFSYEDMTGDKSFLEDYTVTLDGTEAVEGHPCYRITLTARSLSVPYPKEVVWVDEQLFVYRKVEKFALSGRLLKEMVLTDYVTRAGRNIPTGVVMRDVLKKGSSTTFRIDKIDIGIKLPANIFSLEELTW